ncbi:hypothetical protein IWW45_006094, partial [Coemansia sp. RSA 485]
MRKIFARSFGRDIDFGFKAQTAETDASRESQTEETGTVSEAQGELTAADAQVNQASAASQALTLDTAATFGTQTEEADAPAMAEDDLASTLFEAPDEQYATTTGSVAERLWAATDALVDDAYATNNGIKKMISAVVEAQNMQISEYAKTLSEEIGFGVVNFSNRITAAMEGLDEDIYAATIAHAELTSDTAEVFAEKTIVAVNLFGIEVFEAAQIMSDRVARATTTISRLTEAQNREISAAANALRTLVCAATTDLTNISSVVFEDFATKVNAGAKYFAGEGSADAGFQAYEVMSAVDGMARVIKNAAGLLTMQIIYSAQTLREKTRTGAKGKSEPEPEPEPKPKPKRNIGLVIGTIAVK